MAATSITEHNSSAISRRKENGLRARQTAVKAALIEEHKPSRLANA
jgi:hypothetical protein